MWAAPDWKGKMYMHVFAVQYVTKWRRDISEGVEDNNFICEFSSRRRMNERLKNVLLLLELNISFLMSHICQEEMSAPVMKMKDLPCENYVINDHKLNFIQNSSATEMASALTEEINVTLIRWKKRVLKIMDNDAFITSFTTFTRCFHKIKFIFTLLLNVGVERWTWINLYSGILKAQASYWWEIVRHFSKYSLKSEHRTHKRL